MNTVVNIPLQKLCSKVLNKPNTGQEPLKELIDIFKTVEGVYAPEVLKSYVQNENWLIQDVMRVLIPVIHSHKEDLAFCSNIALQLEELNKKSLFLDDSGSLLFLFKSLFFHSQSVFYSKSAPVGINLIINYLKSKDEDHNFLFLGKPGIHEPEEGYDSLLIFISKYLIDNKLNCTFTPAIIFGNSDIGQLNYLIDYSNIALTKEHLAYFEILTLTEKGIFRKEKLAQIKEKCEIFISKNMLTESVLESNKSPLKQKL